MFACYLKFMSFDVHFNNIDNSKNIYFELFCAINWVKFSSVLLLQILNQTEEVCKVDWAYDEID